MGVALQRRVTRSSRSRHRPHIHETKPLPFHVNPIPDRQLPYHSHDAGPCPRNRGRRTGGNVKGKRNPSSTPCVRQNSFASDRLLRAEERMAGVARARGARADSKDTSSRPPSPRGRAEPRQTRQTRPSSPPASAPRPAPPRPANFVVHRASKSAFGSSTPTGAVQTQTPAWKAVEAGAAHSDGARRLGSPRTGLGRAEWAAQRHHCTRIDPVPMPVPMKGKRTNRGDAFAGEGEQAYAPGSA